MNDDLGDRMKEYESNESGRRFLPLLPVMARLDGKCFSSFTSDMARPYDNRMCAAMIETTKFLVKETGAVCGYTQSDEITLAWYSPDRRQPIYFDGRIQKMVSVLASTCSVVFYRLISKTMPSKAMDTPVFDCRVWQMPTLEEATNVFLWREWDATKNSITMAAQAYYDHSELINKNGKEKQEMLWQKGVNWNDYPSFFKRGSYIQVKEIERKFSYGEAVNLPPKHAARVNPDLMVIKKICDRIEMPPLATINNRVDVIFKGAEPINQ